MPHASAPATIALIGYGEVGRILAEDLSRRGVGLSAYDVKLDAPGADADAMRAHAAAHRVTLAASHAEAVAGCDLVVSAVTAASALDVADACAGELDAGTFLLDLNSASPGTKTAAARLVEAGQGHYVEAAVMTSVPPHRLRVPMLLGGPWARTLEPRLQALGLNARVGSDQLGVVSATKMCRSVMIKGMEALVIEAFAAARAYGVEDAVLASLEETFPGIDWQAQGSYFYQRVIEHGRRRSEELRESAATVREAGLPAWMATAIAERQAATAALADAGVFGARGTPGFARSDDWRIEADRLIDAARAQATATVAEDP